MYDVVVVVHRKPQAKAVRQDTSLFVAMPASVSNLIQVQQAASYDQPQEAQRPIINRLQP